MIKILLPPHAVQLGDRQVTMVSTFRDVIMRRPSWRADTRRVHTWLALESLFREHPNGPWPIDEKALLILAEEFSCAGDELRSLPHAEFVFLMACILSIHAALLKASDPEPEPQASPDIVDVTEAEPAASA